MGTYTEKFYPSIRAQRRERGREKAKNQERINNQIADPSSMLYLAYKDRFMDWLEGSLPATTRKRTILESISQLSKLDNIYAKNILMRFIQTIQKYSSNDILTGKTSSEDLGEFNPQYELRGNLLQFSTNFQNTHGVTFGIIIQNDHNLETDTTRLKLLTLTTEGEFSSIYTSLTIADVDACYYTDMSSQTKLFQMYADNKKVDEIDEYDY